jgi:hypothetical protein
MSKNNKKEWRKENVNYAKRRGVKTLKYPA